MAIRAVPKETSERSPEREKLADAIDQFNELNSEITAIRQAIGQTETKRRGALGVVETAKEEIEKAKVSAAENMVSQALGRSSFISRPNSRKPPTASRIDGTISRRLCRRW
jgi:predicted negative regulator of RcsB-dependent stress response